jgi:hypothetical protein
MKYPRYYQLARYGAIPNCGKTICQGCIYSFCKFCKSGNDDKCPFCNSDRGNKTDEEQVGDMTNRADANDAASICLLGNHYEHGLRGFQQDPCKGNGTIR